MPREVLPEGPNDAKIYLVGEAPGAQEDAQGRPFVGSAGKILDRILLDAGISRTTSCRIGNLSQLRPPKNEFDKLDPDRLHQDIASLKWDIIQTRPNIVVVLGDKPLEYLVGEHGVTNWRGSVVWNEELKCKVLVTIHPSAIQYHWTYAPLVLFDMVRAKKESETKEWDSTPPYDIQVAGTMEEVIYHITTAKISGEISFDIETCYGNPVLTAFGFAYKVGGRIVGCCIPFTKGPEHYWNFEQELQVLEYIKTLMEDESVTKIAQNAQFDVAALEYKYGIKVKGLWLDTMCGFHTLYPELPKDLGTITSIYTRHPYYKHWGGSRFWEYNATDAAVTLEAGLSIYQDLVDEETWPFYHDYIHPLIPILVEMQLRGVRVDLEEMKSYAADLEVQEVKAQERLDYIVGHPLNVHSPKQLKELLIDDMGLPPKFHRKTKSVTMDEETLRVYDRDYPNPIFDLILEVRSCRKLRSTYLGEGLVSDDGRMHTSYNLGGRVTDSETGRTISAPATGRLSSSKSIIFNSGANLQNQPHGRMRTIFIPDEGYVMGEVDLAQAEARVVAWLANERRLIKAFLDGQDIHMMNARWVNEVLGDSPQPTKEDRYFAKKHIHAFNYGETPFTFKQLANVPVKGMGEEKVREISMDQARALRRRYFTEYPDIPKWQDGIEMHLRRSRVISTPWGWKRELIGRWGTQPKEGRCELVREALAFIPQHVVVVVINQAIVNFAALVKKEGVDAQVLMQVHDSMVFQFRESDMGWIKDALEMVFDIHIPGLPGGDLVIPFEFKCGPNWGKMEEVK